MAASGAVGRNAFDEEEVALELLDYLKTPYAAELAGRYKLAAVDGLRDEQLLDEIGRKSGALLPGARVNTQKAAEVVLADFRGGRIGRITLETPAEFSLWLAEGKQLDAERQLRKDTLASEGLIRVKPPVALAPPKRQGAPNSAQAPKPRPGGARAGKPPAKRVVRKLTTVKIKR